MDEMNRYLVVAGLAAIVVIIIITAVRLKKLHNSSAITLTIIALFFIMLGAKTMGGLNFEVFDFIVIFLFCLWATQRLIKHYLKKNEQPAEG